MRSARKKCGRMAKLTRCDELREGYAKEGLKHQLLIRLLTVKILNIGRNLQQATTTHLSFLTG